MHYEVSVSVSLVDLPAEWCGRPIRLVLQTKKEYLEPPFQFTIIRKADRKGELQWTGDAVHFHGDGRRFIYFAWLENTYVSWKMFRRIKLYLTQIPNLGENPTVQVTLSGKGKDGSPACSTAIIVPGKSIR
ncbi:MAG: DUF5990 family protein [Fimbriimonadaceae bacterium]